MQDRPSSILQTVTGQDLHRVVSTDNREYIITWFRWVNDERLLVSVRFAATRDAIGFTIETRLLAVNRDGTSRCPICSNSPSFFSFSGTSIPQFQDRLVGTIPGDPRHVLLALDLEHPNAPDVYKVDVVYRRSTVGQANPVHSRTPRRLRSGSPIGQERCGRGSDNFRRRCRRLSGYRSPVFGVNWLTMIWSGDRLVPLAFDADPAWLYVRDQHRGKAAIFKLNVTDPDADRVVVADPKFDLNGELVYAPGRKKVIGVRYSEADERVLFWDFDAQRLQARNRSRDSAPSMSSTAAATTGGCMS